MCNHGFFLPISYIYKKKTIMKRLTKEQFIEKAKSVHGDKYDYSKVEYVNNKTKVLIICPEHGEFTMKPNCHVDSRQGCPKCGYRKMGKERTIGTEVFISRAIEIHGDKYDYSKVNYTGTDDEVCIICPKHGEFWQTPHNHIGKRQGCPKCYGNNKLSTDEFIEKAKKVHGEKYGYEKSVYVNKRTPIEIVCEKHGSFFQLPSDHLRGHGCPKCHHSKLEDSIRDFLKKNGFSFSEEKTFDDLKYKRKLRFDFYIEDRKVAIECQGEQHYTEVNFGNKNKTTDELLSETKDRDRIKKEYCEKNGITLLYYSIPKNKKYDRSIITSKKELKRQILLKSD